MGRSSWIRDMKDPRKRPSWLVTFADLMTLLLCFFVLLLSFSEIELHKFKILTGSFKRAFGVQRLEYLINIPEGTDVISKEFDDPWFIDYVLKKKVRAALRATAMTGNVRLEEDEVSVRVTIPNQVLFDSGSAQVKEGAYPILNSFKEVVRGVPHRVSVVGHTDNVPIHTEKYPSNWELSSARAAAVIRYLLAEGDMWADRFVAEGRADTVPVAPNDSPENRAKNRRVELVFHKKLAVPDHKPSTPFGNKPWQFDDPSRSDKTRDAREWPFSRYFWPDKPGADTEDQ